MMKNITWLGHSGIKFSADRILYVDPFQLQDEYHDADIIFVTHGHFDHLSPDDIKKCLKDTTRLVIPEDAYEDGLALGLEAENIICVLPGNSYEIDTVRFDAVPAYNVGKDFHPKENKWVGYIIEIDSVKYYIAGDTDINEDNSTVKCDVAFLPVGGTYTMTGEEAAELANRIEPKVAVPTHYGSIVGTEEDAVRFKENLKETIQCEMLK